MGTHSNQAYSFATMKIGIVSAFLCVLCMVLSLSAPATASRATCLLCCSVPGISCPAGSNCDCSEAENEEREVLDRLRDRACGACCAMNTCDFSEHMSRLNCTCDDEAHFHRNSTDFECHLCCAGERTVGRLAPVEGICEASLGCSECGSLDEEERAIAEDVFCETSCALRIPSNGCSCANSTHFVDDHLEQRACSLCCGNPLGRNCSDIFDSCHCEHVAPEPTCKTCSSMRTCPSLSGVEINTLGASCDDFDRMISVSLSHVLQNLTNVIPVSRRQQCVESAQQMLCSGTAYSASSFGCSRRSARAFFKPSSATCRLLRTGCGLSSIPLPGQGAIDLEEMCQRFTECSANGVVPGSHCSTGNPCVVGETCSDSLICDGGIRIESCDASFEDGIERSILHFAEELRDRLTGISDRSSHLNMLLESGRGRLSFAGAVIERLILDNVTIALRETSESPSIGIRGVNGISRVYILEPHGQTFADDIEVTLSFDPSLLNASEQLVILRRGDDNGNSPWSVFSKSVSVAGPGQVMFRTKTFSSYMVAGSEESSGSPGRSSSGWIWGGIAMALLCCVAVVLVRWKGSSTTALENGQSVRMDTTMKVSV